MPGQRVAGSAVVTTRLPTGGLALLGLLLPVATLAQPLPRPGLDPAAEARQSVDIRAAPWSSLVRVQTEAGTHCTGALIAPDRVLTAAHCLVAPRTGNLVLPTRTHVLAGYERGEFRAHATVREFRLGPGFDPASRGPFGADWALLRLASPLPGPTLPRAPLPAAGTPAMLAGFQQDRAHALLADTDCAIEAPYRDEARRLLLRHGCAATRGASGGPLLVRQGEGWAIAGIAAGAQRQARGGLAVALEGLALD
ncbi:trypsin-like serine protease [Roseomonas stagni]|uniref:Trypsin-like serine protease n=1 Tax=Falsiroseomonas algicola TaxID=2716930 RepID=A0A6M1LMY3_9PROT|nr:trypsin-like serine protease [Falsiroseomonas algicola]NGM21369.1 trypsin-like serine protease [Falsiroseomonas algicola]